MLDDTSGGASPTRLPVVVPGRVALLTNFIAPYRVTTFEELQARVAELRIFLSTSMESDRDWAVDWGQLNVVLQRTVTLRRRYSDAFGFSRILHIHIPYDTLWQLFRFKPAAIISQELGLRTVQAVIYKIMRPKVKLVIWATLSEHSERGWGPFRKALRRFILQRVDAVLVNGESGARYIRSFGLPDSSVLRINQPVDVQRFALTPRARPDGAKSRLMQVGTLTARKGCDRFLRVLIEWALMHPDRHVELWWLGDGELRSTLEAIETPANLSQRFCGSVPYADLQHWYAQADILVFPSLLDEWGLVVNEAMASGMPVLGSSYSQAVEELITDGVTGWTFDPLSREQTLAAINRALDTDTDSLIAMREAARKRISELTPASASERIAQGLRQLISGSIAADAATR